MFLYLQARLINRADLPADLARRFSCTGDSIRKAVDELVANGYVKMVRSADGGNAITYEALVKTII